MIGRRNGRGGSALDHFVIHTPYQPTGDQPEAIAKLVSGVNMGL